jgi:EAL domain-containing protein (putative c-di-GMP-specific phosphodiesterase class I)
MRQELSYAGVIEAGHAMRAGWVEFWYQPKVDLSRNEFVGIEMFARARHPFHGVLTAEVFLKGADKTSLSQLAAASINAALRASQSLIAQKVYLPITVNVPGPLLNTDLVATVRTIVEQNRPQDANWPGLIFDVSAQDIAADRPRFAKVADELGWLDIKLAADDFGQDLRLLIQSDNLSAVQSEIEQLSKRLLQLKTIMVTELKLDRKLVAGCASNPAQAAVCTVLIDLIHHLGATAVAIGLEKAEDVVMLRQMKCDIGQGHYFCEPMPLDALLALLNQKARKQKNAAILRRK